MPQVSHFTYEPWPLFSYAAFKPTGYLLHRGVQMMGKLKLNTPFEPHWANVVLPLTSRGLTTGPIPYQGGVFSLDIDLISHQLEGNTSWGMRDQFDLAPTSVAQLYKQFSLLLQNLGIDVHINTMPQEVSHPIAFEQDMEEQNYDKTHANSWWRILVSSYQVLQRYHARFNGETPPMGLMWGTFDLRDARYNGVRIPATGMNAGYILRNAMDEGQIEAGWWSGSEAYPHAAYYSFTYPQPEKIEQSKIKPEAARWEPTLGAFLLDYNDLKKSFEPDKELLIFFESAYQSGASSSGWNSNFIMPGQPV